VREPIDREATTGAPAAPKPLFIKREALPALVALSISTIEEEIRQGRFPRPRKLSGNRVGWLLRELEAWAESRPVSEQPPPPNTGAPKPRNRGAAA
jgi:prophage regulatory protein